MPQPGKILVVDDREANRLLMREMLEAAGHQVLVAPDGPGAIGIAVEERPDVILLDVRMPGMDGFEVCARLQGQAETVGIPIIFVTANYAEDADVVHGLEIGAYDYLVKPVTRVVLLARVAVMVRIHRSEERIRQLSMVDEFTGLFSKNYVVRRLDEEMKRAERFKTPLAVTMLDLDDFKICNDTFGHQFGDEVLKRVAAALRGSVRQYDSLGRYGGEEFLLVQPETLESEALAMIGRLKDRVQEERFNVDGQEIRVSFSAGVAAWDHRMSMEQLIGAADRALYAAKRRGKNQTVCASAAEAEAQPATQHH